MNHAEARLQNALPVQKRYSGQSRYGNVNAIRCILTLGHYMRSKNGSIYKTLKSFGMGEFSGVARCVVIIIETLAQGRYTNRRLQHQNWATHHSQCLGRTLSQSFCQTGRANIEDKNKKYKCCQNRNLTEQDSKIEWK